jgi:predicted DNA-binding transcriptional regulator AlpA
MAKTTKPTEPDPVGAVEIAARLGVERRTVDSWRQRDLGFPDPRWTVGGRPAWDWADVVPWAAARGHDVTEGRPA